MSAVQFCVRADIEKRLRPYRCRLLETLADGTEMWITGWHYPFTLTPESDDMGTMRYDAWQLEEVFATVIARTMPKGFDSAVEYLDEVRERRAAKTT